MQDNAGQLALAHPDVTQNAVLCEHPHGSSLFVTARRQNPKQCGFLCGPPGWKEKLSARIVPEHL